eukprot:CAMPEP_0183363558 /NCGR_PEP_ID=MMETSP0164_2-20130417/75733_1 /TAXON_ID=221442 /ORGANISM="Coccolithus pelagicus ssp braarudi, Strain PLY182g" /LENGTH=141 /DNA_ID=CAMNT_0025538679 /DNA_START=128 /DNA_END=553 /DNA_ORIENTATION=+
MSTLEMVHQHGMWTCVVVCVHSIYGVQSERTEPHREVYLDQSAAHDSCRALASCFSALINRQKRKRKRGGPLHLSKPIGHQRHPEFVLIKSHLLLGFQVTGAAVVSISQRHALVCKEGMHDPTTSVDGGHKRTQYAPSTRL